METAALIFSNENWKNLNIKRQIKSPKTIKNKIFNFMKKKSKNKNKQNKVATSESEKTKGNAEREGGVRLDETYNASQRD